MNLLEQIRQTSQQGPRRTMKAIAQAPLNVIGGMAKGMYDSVDRQANPQNYRDDAGNYYPGQAPGQPEDALNIALSAMTSSMPFAPRGAGTLGTVKHIGSTTYNEKLATLAKLRIMQNESVEKVWHETGYHPLGLNEYKPSPNTSTGMQSEIIDTGTFWNSSVLNKLLNHIKTSNKPEQVAMQDVIRHKELFKNYPELKQEPLEIEPYSEEFMGGYTPGDSRISLSAEKPSAVALRNMYKTFLHELDHKLTFSSPKESGLRGIANPNAAPASNLDYLQLPYESTARMRESRWEGPKKLGSNGSARYFGESSLLNSPLSDLGALRHGSLIHNLAPWLTAKQKIATTSPKTIGPDFSAEWLKQPFD